MKLRIFFQVFRPYLVCLLVSALLIALASFLFFERGGQLIEDYESWIVLRFWKWTVILFPVWIFSIFVALRFGQLRVIILAAMVAVIHIGGVVYMSWMLGQLNPEQSALDVMAGAVETKFWPYPIWNFLRDVTIPIVSYWIVSHLTNHSSKQALPAGTPDGAP